MPPLKVFLVDGAENNEVVGLLFGQGLRKVIIDLFFVVDCIETNPRLKC